MLPPAAIDMNGATTAAEDWEHSRQREARKDRIETILKERDYPLDFNQIQEEVETFAGTGNTGAVSSSRTSRRCWRRWWRRYRMQQDGETQTVTGRPMHPEQAVA